MQLPETEKLLTELPDNRVGEDCEYDNAYMEMDELAVPVDSSEMGDSVVEGRDADFKSLFENASSLWGKTRDLRVATYYAIAAFCNEGLAGLKQGLQMIDYLVSNMWDVFYPQLDPDDDNDPTERINILNMISPPAGSFSDPIKFINHFRKVKLVDSLPYSLRDVLIAQGMLESADEPVDLVMLQGQMRSVPYEEIETKANLLAEIQELLNKIADTMNEKIGDYGYINFESLNAEIKQLKKVYDTYTGGQQSDEVQENAAQEGVNEVQIKNESAAAAAPLNSGSAAGIVNVKSYRVTNRDDALLLIQKCADYFAKAEPTSPLPYFLKRALRMADMNFIDILGEIDQNSLEKAREQLGVIVTPE